MQPRPKKVLDQVREAIRLVERCGVGGGLVLGASNTVSFDVPVENIAAWYEGVRDYEMQRYT